MSTYSPSVIVTGGDGQLAAAISHHDLSKQFNLHFCNHSELDITSPTSINQAIAKYIPDVIINCAAYTAVDKAEEEVSKADRVNHIGAGHLGLICHKNQIKLIHLSTDYVFDGSKTDEYVEDDHADPINMYGKTKWLGEQAIRENCKNHVILRISSVFSEYGHNFVRTILKAAHEKPVLRVVSDQSMCPTYAGHIAGALLTIAGKPAEKGTFHYCSSEPISWHGFASAIVNETKKHGSVLTDEIRAIPSTEFPTKAKRPQQSVLNCNKIKETYNIEQPSWREAIKSIIPKLIQEKA